MTRQAPSQSAAADRLRLAAAVAAAPGNPALRRQFAAALAAAGEPRAALEQYRQLLALTPGDPLAAAQAGMAAKRAGLEEVALPLVRPVAEANPRHPLVWQVLALLHRGTDDLAPAIDAYRRAAALAPADVKIAHGLARAALEAGLPAVDLYRAARRLAPRDDHILLGLAAARHAEEGPDAALATLEREVRDRPEWLPGHAQLARLRWASGQSERFTESLEQALLLRPRDLALWRELIAVLLHAGRHEATLDAVARGRAACGEDDIFAANEAVARAELGQYEEADRLFAALAGLGDPTIVVRHARHLLRTGRPDAAVAVGEPLIRTPHANLIWPYLAIAWRLTADPRWEWLEGDSRLVGVYDLGPELPSLDALAARLRGLHRARGQPLEQSVRGGTQTDGPLFARIEPEIRALRAAVEQAVRAHIAQLPPAVADHPTLAPRRDRPVRFSGSWSVRLAGSGCHANHIHPAGWFSSALYVALPDEAERGPAPAGWLTLGEPQAELRIDLEPFRLVEPKPGRLVLFPSTMWHGTRPFDAGERLTVAFDVAPPV